MRGLMWAAVLVAGLAACTTDSGDDRAKTPDGKAATLSPVTGEKACGDGTFTWSAIRRTEQLAGISQAREVTGEVARSGVELELPMRRVATPQVSVDAQGPALSSAEILFSLGKRAGEIGSTARTLAEDSGMEYVFTQVSGRVLTLDTSPVPISGAGVFARYDGVTDIQGDFRYTCADGTSVQGHARSWSDGVSGILNCEKPLDGGAVPAAAARSACEPGSAALRSS
ncbi:hypothetical protein [Streptomyces acidiscabies]|uniref:hypothetical protein n=1 Tax=Streptomyces acidiscabies TaxID=42234 RepID=UPI0038F81B2E